MVRGPVSVWNQAPSVRHLAPTCLDAVASDVMNATTLSSQSVTTSVSNDIHRATVRVKSIKCARSEAFPFFRHKCAHF